MALPLSSADFDTLPPTTFCILSSPEPVQIYTWQFGDEKKKKEELALPSSESRSEMEFFFLSYFLFLISRPAVKYHIMQSRLRK